MLAGVASGGIAPNCPGSLPSFRQLTDNNTGSSVWKPVGVYFAEASFAVVATARAMSEATCDISPPSVG